MELVRTRQCTFPAENVPREPDMMVVLKKLAVDGLVKRDIENQFTSRQMGINLGRLYCTNRCKSR